jgi:hypothetical protein
MSPGKSALNASGGVILRTFMGADSEFKFFWGVICNIKNDHSI